jgi:hypothetical protein
VSITAVYGFYLRVLGWHFIIMDTGLFRPRVSLPSECMLTPIYFQVAGAFVHVLEPRSATVGASARAAMLYCVDQSS